MRSNTSAFLCASRFLNTRHFSTRMHVERAGRKHGERGRTRVILYRYIRRVVVVGNFNARNERTLLDR